MKAKIKSSPTLQGGIAIFIVLIIFSAGYLSGVLSNMNINLPLIQQVVNTTAPTTTEPTTTVPVITEPSTTEPTTTEPTTTEAPTTTTAPSTTQAEDECCLTPIIDFITDTFGSLFSQLPGMC